MILDSHQHVMFPTQRQLTKLDQAGLHKAILFSTSLHVEQAPDATLASMAREMASLDRILSGQVSSQARQAAMEQAILELKGAIAASPDRFYGFGPVPLGLSAPETARWIETHIVENGFLGLGEFTPGTPEQMAQLEPVFQALAGGQALPVWVHTFHPVSPAGIRRLMALCRAYPAVPVIWGHLGGVHWMEVIAFVKGQRNSYLDLSASYTPLAVKTALTEVPERCLFSSDAPFGEPFLARQLIEFVSPSSTVTRMALGENAQALLGL